MNRLKNKRGVILLFVLWSLIILTALSVSLGRGAQIDMALTKTYLSKLKAHYAAWGGIMYAMGLLEMDKEDATSFSVDSLYYCGIKKSERSSEALFKNVDLNDATFDISYKYQQDPEKKPEESLGMHDEERKININALNTQNIFIAIELLKSLGVEEESAQIIAYSIIDWKDTDKEIATKDFGAEDDYYESLGRPYLTKNRPFDMLEELLLVRGMNSEIYAKVIPYLTVFPKQAGMLQINFNTASKAVLEAVAFSMAGSRTNTDQSQATSLIDKVVNYRAGADGIDATEDDQEIDISKMSLTAEESTIFYAIFQYRSNNSNYFRINVVAREKDNPYQANIQAIISRDNKEIVYWQRN